MSIVKSLYILKTKIENLKQINQQCNSYIIFYKTIILTLVVNYYLHKERIVIWNDKTFFATIENFGIYGFQVGNLF